MTPHFESFEDSEKLLVVNIVVDFSAGKGARMKSDWVDLAVRQARGENPRKSVVRHVGFDE